MPIIVYSVAIILVCAAFVIWFFYSRKKYIAKQKQLLSDLLKPSEPSKDIEVKQDKAPEIDAQFEDFVLEEEENTPSRPKANTFSFNRRTNVARSDIPDKNSQEQNDESDDDDLEEKFKAYEKFLREKLSAADDEDEQEESDSKDENKDSGENDV